MDVDDIVADLAQALGSATFRLYHSTDVRGVEIGGAAKNVDKRDCCRLWRNRCLDRGIGRCPRRGEVHHLHTSFVHLGDELVSIETDR